MPKQLKHTVTYRQNEIEQDLFTWVEKERGLIKAGDFIKQILLDKKLNDKVYQKR